MAIAGALLIIDSGEQDLTMDSNNAGEDWKRSIDLAYSKEFTLGQDQTCHITFKNNYENVTVFLKIFSIGVYDQLVADNDTSGTGSSLYGTGLTMRKYIRSMYQDISDVGLQSSVTILTISWDDSETSEEADFKGNNLQSVPGTYVVVVYGWNEDSVNTDNDEITFDLTITVDGPGQILFEIFLLSGVVLITAVLVFLFYSFIKRETGGR